MNGRYQQRMIDPRVDLITAPWSAFNSTPWILPLMNERDGQREEINDMIDKYYIEGYNTATFVTDFPGLDPLARCLSVAINCAATQPGRTSCTDICHAFSVTALVVHRASPLMRPPLCTRSQSSVRRKWLG